MKKKYKIGIIPGDGIGRDVIKAAKIVLDTINQISKTFILEFFEMETGESAYLKHGDPFPKATVDGIRQTDAVLFGAAGNPHTSKVISGFRRGFDLYAKVSPIKSLPGIHAIQPKADFIIVREATEGLFRKVGFIDDDYHVNLRVFTTKGMDRIIRYAFNLAMKLNRKKVTLTHKAHVLAYTDAPFLKMFNKIAEEYPDVVSEDITIDACAMQMVMKPERFQIVLAENANGDILGDLGAGIIGGLGFAASANIGEAMAVFEPIHGTAPKYADKNIVNPIAAILSAKMMLDYLGEVETAGRLETSIISVLQGEQVRTYDLGGTASTTEMAEAISEQLLKKH